MRQLKLAVMYPPTVGAMIGDTATTSIKVENIFAESFPVGLVRKAHCRTWSLVLSSGLSGLPNRFLLAAVLLPTEQATAGDSLAQYPSSYQCIE